MIDSRADHDDFDLSPRRAPMRLRPRPRRARISPLEQVELDAILQEDVEFISSPEFARSGAERRIYDRAEQIARPDVSWYRPLVDRTSSSRSDAPRPTRTVLLSAAQERVLFLKLNYARYRMARLQRKLRKDPSDLEAMREILHWARRATQVREQIAETNLALVLAMAKRIRAAEIDFADLVSEGNMALMRSVDKFDCERGFKFSTYACRAILKAFSRHGMKVSKYRQRFPVEFDPEREQGDHVGESRDATQRESAAEVKHLVHSNRADLSDVERRVITLRFAIDQPIGSQPLTLEQVGNQIGVTKERVRQIQNNALAKLRTAFDGDTPAGTATAN